MRSLIVTDSLLHNAETEYALAVAGAESEMGFDVTVAAPHGSAALGRAPSGVRAAPLPGASLSRSPADLLATCRWIAGFARDGADVIVHSSGSPAHVAAALARTSSSKLVHLRGGAAIPSGGALNRHLYRRRTDAVMASSARVESWVRERLGMRSDRLFRAYVPVDMDRFAGDRATSGLREELGISCDVPLAVNVARLAPVKGHSVLLEAWARVVHKHPLAVLLLVGEAWSGQPEALKALAEKLDIAASVRFAGRRDDVPRILASSDLCICSSIGSEENSRAVSEYMAAGRPVAATSVGVIPELVVQGETGVLAAPGEVDGLARAVLELLDDPRRAAAMGESGRARARELCSRQAFSRQLAGVLSATGFAVKGARQ